MNERLGVVLDFGNVVAYFDHMRACRRLAALSREDLTASEVHERAFEAGVEEAYDRGRLSTDDFLREIRQRVVIPSSDASDGALRESWCDIFWQTSRPRR